MTKKIISALLALVMLCMTACGDSSQADTSKAETTTVTEQTESNTDSSDAEDTTTTTTTTADTTTTTSDTSSKKEEKSTTTTKATTKATTTTKAVATTTKQAVVTTQATYTYKPVQTTKATTRATTKAITKATTKATQATRATQPAKNKSALDLAYEAVILGTSTKAQRDLICNDLNNYVISKGYSKKLDKSLYALSDANGKPVEDVTKAVGWGNCGYYGGWDNSNYTTEYLLGTSTLEQAREHYKAGLRNNTDYCAKSITKKNGYAFNIVMYKDTGNAVQRLDLMYKHNVPRYTLVLCYH